MEKGEIIEGKVDWKGRPTRKGKHGGMFYAMLSLCTSGFENMATIALVSNLVTYMTQVMQFNISDAANQVTNFLGTGYILSIPIAALADLYIGRPKSVLISACFEIVGLGLLAIQAYSHKLKPPLCNLFDPTAQCTKVEGSQAGLLFLGLYLVATGSAGIKAAVPPHGSDQVEEKDPKEVRQMSSFFNWFLFVSGVGTAASLTLIVWIQDNKGWDLGFGTSCFAMIAGTLLFLSGLPRYRIHVIQKVNPLIEIIQERGEVIADKVDWKGRPARRGKHGGMRFALLSISTFSFENMATIALATNLVTYLTEVMHFNVSNSANTITNYMGTSYILSILIACLADMVIGRPKSVVISACFEIVGLGLLAIQAHSSKLKPPPCNLFDPTAHCTKVGGGNAALLFGGLYLVATGSSGIKASLPSHGADQFDEKDPKEARQMSSFFNWFLLSGNIGSVASLTLVVWIQDNKGWDKAFGLSSIGMIVGALLFISGLPRYRIHVIQRSNALVEIIQVYVAAFRNRNLELPEDPEDLYEINRDKEAGTETEFLPHRDVYKFLDKAAIQATPITQNGNPNPWKLCRVTQVENAKIILGVLPIFCCAIIMTLCLAQLQTFSIQQAVTMDTRLTKHFHIPAASLAIIPIIFLLGLVPIYDRFFVPFARRITGHPTGITHLQRIGVGLVLSCLSMAVAGLMEVKRKEVARKHNMLDAIPVIQPLPISVFWLSFQFFIFGIADLFSFIGLLEFFYSQAPKGIKSISTCFLWCSMALGYFTSTIIVNIVNSATKGITKSRGWLGGNNINRNHLNLFYWLLSLLSFLNFLLYLYVAKRYKYKPIVQAQRGSTNRKVSNDDNMELEDIEVR